MYVSRLPHDSTSSTYSNTAYEVMSNQDMEALVEAPLQGLNLLSWRCLLALCEIEAWIAGLDLLNWRCFLALYADALKYEGFLSPKEGGIFLQLPRAFLRLMLRLTGAAVKVVLYIFDQTWGYHDYDGKRKLSLDEIMFGRKKADGTRIDEGTGLSEGAARNAVRESEMAGIIICDVDDRDRGRIVTSYGIHVRHIEPEQEDHQTPDEKRDVSSRGTKNEPLTEQLDTRTQNSTLARGTKNEPLDFKKCTSESQKMNPWTSKNVPRTGKDTFERNSLKETPIKKDSAAPLTEKELTQRALSFPPLSQRISSEDFRTMPEGPDAILAGLAQKLPIPDGEAIKASGDQALMSWYQLWVWQPVVWMAEKTKDVSLLYTWQKEIYRRASGAVDTGAPSWFASQRVQNSPVFPRHLVGYDKKTGELTGKQWGALEKELSKGNWWPDAALPYDGPPYEDGYGGEMVTQESEQQANAVVEVVAGEVVGRRVTQPLSPEPETEPYETFPVEDTGPSTDEMVACMPDSQAEQEENETPMIARPELRGMTVEVSQRLIDEITAEQPNIQGEFDLLDDGSYILKIFDSDLSHFAIWRPQDWRRPAPCNVRRIADAIAYGNWLNGEPEALQGEAHACYQRGMTLEQVDDLQAMMRRQYPSLILHSQTIDDGSSVIKVMCGRGKEFTIRCAQEWQHPERTMQKSIMQAILYSKVEAKRKALYEEGA